VLGLGIDVVEIGRIRRALEKWGTRFEDRILTREELVLCRSKNDFSASFAVRFAAKEAFFKALPGNRTAHLSWHDVVVLNAPSGRPYIALSPHARQLLGRHKVHVSLTHSRETAAAVVLIE